MNSVMQTGERKHAKISFKNKIKNQVTQRLAELSVKQQQDKKELIENWRGSYYPLK